MNKDAQYADTMHALGFIGHAILNDEVVGQEIIKKLQSKSRINRLNRDFWAATCDRLSNLDMGELIVGMTYAERHMAWTGGSAASSIWIFQHLVERCTDQIFIDQIAAWVITNGTNPYSPFGTRVSLGARDYSEYVALRTARRKRISKFEQADNSIEERATAERALRYKRASQAVADQRSYARDELIAELDELSVSEQLRRIAEDQYYPPQFFPTRVPHSTSDAVIASLDYATRLELARRLKGKRRGPWGSFKKRLLRTLGPVWNKEPWNL